MQTSTWKLGVKILTISWNRSSKMLINNYHLLKKKNQRTDFFPMTKTVDKNNTTRVFFPQAMVLYVPLQYNIQRRTNYEQYTEQDNKNNFWRQ